MNVNFDPQARIAGELTINDVVDCQTAVARWIEKSVDPGERRDLGGLHAKLHSIAMAELERCGRPWSL